MRLIFFLIFFCFPFLLSSQEISIERFSGIPDNSAIYDILVQDSSIYVASSSGLFHVDAGSLESKVIRGISCEALCADQKGDVWASFENRYIEHIESGNKANYNISNLQVTDIQNYKGRVWISSDQGILELNSRTYKINSNLTTRNSDLPSNDIVFLHMDDNNQMWIGTETGVVLINKKERWKIYEKRQSMEAMHYNHEGLWLVSNKEMWVVDPFNRWYPAAIDRGLREGNIRDITADSTGRLYMASDILVRYDPYKEEIESYADAPALISKLCSTVESDRNNRIWVGTKQSGLYVIGFKEEAKKMDLTALCIIEKKNKCPGDLASISLNIYGGDKPYKIEWSDGVKNEKKRNLSPGVYSVNVTDFSGKTSSSNISIDKAGEIGVSLVEFEQETIPGRKDASASLSVYGGIPPYDIRWPNGERGTKAFKLTNGLHEVKVIDQNKCVTTTQVEILADRILPELQLAKIKVGQTLRIDQLFFLADSTEIVTESYPVLDEIFSFLNTNKSVIIEIGGHTNSIPSHDYCDKLSTERAKNVAYYLFNRGIDQERISFKGYGKRNPIATNRSVAGRQKNQRVEIKIMQIAG